MQKAEKERARRSPRRWVVPPGLGALGEPFAGWHVVDELRSPLGVLLWQSLRDAMLWAGMTPEQRRRLFIKGAGERRRDAVALHADRELRAPLLLLTRVLDNRDGNRAADLSEACQAVSRWAEARGLCRTALAFAEGAAAVAPDQAGPAYAVGMLARRGAEHRRAETWFRRALGLARRSGDWKHYALACIGLGGLGLQRGELGAARAWLVKALRTCRRHGLWSVKPMVLHELFSVSAAAENVHDAERSARAAFRAYGRRHPRLLLLVHDVARWWLRQGWHARVLPIFQAVLPHVRERPARLEVLASLARAAGYAGRRIAFADAWDETWRLVDRSDDEENVAAALIQLGEGAAALGDRDRAGMAAMQALAVAERRREERQRAAAEHVLVSLRRPRTPPPCPPEQDPALVAASDELAAAFVDALTADAPEE